VTLIDTPPVAAGQEPPMRQVFMRLVDQAKVRLGVGSEAGLPYRPLVASTLPPLGNGTAGPASVDVLVQRAIHRIILAALAARALVLPVIMLALLAHAQVHHVTFPSASLLGGVALVGVINLVLLVYLSARRRPRLLLTPGFLVADVALAAFLYAWVALTVREGLFFHPEWDALWLYMMGTVALWTGVRGVRTAAAIIAAGVLVQVVATRVNGVPLGSLSWLVVAARELWLGAALLGTLVMLSLSQQGALAAAAEGLRAGQEAERARMLRTMHDSVLQNLEALLLDAGRYDLPVRQRLDQLQGGVRRQISDIRVVLRHDEQAPGAGLTAALQALGEEFSGRGLRVRLVTAELDIDPSVLVAQALVGATQEALANVAKHAGVQQAVVRVASADGGVEITVRDHGCGFDPDRPADGFGIAQSIIGRMRDVGGRATVWSAPDRGTRVTLWGPP
jgi:signal transduction histidine kinase